MIKVQCGKCNENLEVPSSMAGQHLSCPECGHDQLISDENVPITTPLENDGDGKEPEEFSRKDNSAAQKFSFDKGTATLTEYQFKRPLIKKGTSASRVRIFTCRLSEGAVRYMQEQMNNWLDENPDIEIKFASSTVGVVESKTHDPHLIITTWY